MTDLLRLSAHVRRPSDHVSLTIRCDSRYLAQVRVNTILFDLLEPHPTILFSRHIAAIA